MALAINPNGENGAPNVQWMHPNDCGDPLTSNQPSPADQNLKVSSIISIHI